MSIAFTLAQLQYFCGVAELGSFSAAASAQHVSSNAVSSAVNALEEALGAQLCTRQRSRGVELTSTGRLLYDEAKELLGRAEEISVSISGRAEEPLLPLSLGCVPPLAPTVLTRLTDAFARRHPRSSLGLAVQAQNQLVERLRARELDCAILYDIDVPAEFEKRELYRRTAHVLLSKRHRLSGRKSINLRELAQDQLILLESPPTRDYTLRLIRECGITPEVRYEVSDHEVSRALVARNLGYTVTILDTVIDKSEIGRSLVRVPIAPKPPEEGISIVWRQESTGDQRIRELVDLATQHAARPSSRGL